MFELKFSNQSEKFIKKSENKIKTKLQTLFFILHENPIPAKTFDTKKISDSKNKYRIRIGKIRIQYSIFWEEKIIRILKITKRKESTYKR